MSIDNDSSSTVTTESLTNKGPSTNKGLSSNKKPSINKCSALKGKNVLALDASSDFCSLALSHRDSSDTLSLISDSPRSHAKTILPMTDELLCKAGLKLSEIDLIALTNGPGSFTGIRIAVSVAQGLSYGTGIPCLPVSSLTAMANGVLEEKTAYLSGDYIVCSLDARMKEVYWALYQCRPVSIGSKQVFLEECVGPSIAKYSDFLVEAGAAIKQNANKQNAKIDADSLTLYLLGNGWSVLELNGQNEKTVAMDSKSAVIAELTKVLTESWEERMKIPSFEFFLDDTVQPSALGIMRYLSTQNVLLSEASHSSEFNEHLRDAASLEPLYIRNEVSWQKRKRIRES